MFCGLVDEDLSSSKSVLPSAIVEAHASNVESRWAPKKQNLLLVSTILFLFSHKNDNIF